MSQQDEQLDDLASSMSTLKQMSRQIGHEVDEQAVWVAICLGSFFFYKSFCYAGCPHNFLDKQRLRAYYS